MRIHHQLFLCVSLIVSTCRLFAEQPRIDSIENNHSYLLASPNNGIAQGCIFIIRGANLSNSSTGLQNVPLQTTLNGVSAAVTVGGTTTNVIWYYVLPTQLGGILPSNTPVGTGTIRVTNNGQTSAAAQIVVVRSAFGTMTLNGAGTGTAAVYDTKFRLLSSTNSAKPGDTLAFFGSGVGPVTGDETVLQTQANLPSIPVVVRISGVSGNVQYRGRTIFPGLDQINVVVPALTASQLGCSVPVIVEIGSFSSNRTTIPISANGGTCQEPAQPTYLNFDFETTTRGRVWGWYPYGSGHQVAMDTAASVSGAQSVRIRSLNNGQPGTTLQQHLPLEVGRGRHLRFSGFIRTEGVTVGTPALGIRVDGPNGTISVATAPLEPGIGTTDWRNYVIESDVSPDAVGIVFGVLQPGNGTAWFDNLGLEVDGVPYVQGPAPHVGEPTEKQLSWVRQTAIPLATPDPGSGFGDLSAFMGMVGDAHIVGLGEGTHGTSEFFRMKHRLLEFLATRMGFTIFAIEANMPEAYKLNDYVLNGVGDPRKLLQGMYFWTWNTQEVLDMILWMRQFNLSGQGPVQFTGFDMQYGSVARDNVRRLVMQVDPGYLPTLDSAFADSARVETNRQRGVAQSNASVQMATDAVRAVWQYLVDHRSDYLEKSSEETVDWAIQNAQIVEQATYIAIGGSIYRDRCMASNMEWILARNPGARAVIWAHNFHVSRAVWAMGSYLAAAHGRDYLPVGQIFHAGRYNAVVAGRPVENFATPSFAGAVEYVLHSADTPRLILDLRAASADDPGSSWLIGQTQYRSIGSVPHDGFFFSPLSRDFDALIFFDQTNPSALLPFTEPR